MLKQFAISTFFSVVLISLFSTNPVHAADFQSHAFDIISYEQFHSLSISQKQIYIRGLRDMLVEINADETGVTTSLWQNWLGEFSFADGELVGSTCVYAGNLTSRGDDGFCKRPESKDCSAGQVPCNPLIFGALCVPSGRRATMDCMARAADLDTVRKLIDASPPDKWNQMRKDLANYCASNSQPGPCGIIQRRITDLHRDAGIDLIEIGKKAIIDAINPAPAKPEVGSKDPVKAETSPIKTSKGDGTCKADLLLATVHCTNVPGKKRHPSPGGDNRHFFEAPDAYQAFCTKNKSVPPEADKIVSDQIENTEACLKKDLNSQDPLTRSIAHYNHEVLNAMESNYKNCAQLLSEGKLAHSGPQNIQLSLKDKYSSTFHGLPGGDKSVFTFGIGRIYTENKLSICDVKVLPNAVEQGKVKNSEASGGVDGK